MEKRFGHMLGPLFVYLKQGTHAEAKVLAKYARGRRRAELFYGFTQKTQKTQFFYFSQSAQRAKVRRVLWGHTELFRITQRTQSIRGRKVFVTEVHKGIFLFSHRIHKTHRVRTLHLRPPFGVYTTAEQNKNSV